MRLSVVCLLFIALGTALADFATLSFKGNVTVSSEDSQQFRARAITFAAASLPLSGGKGFTYSSVSVKGNGDGTGTIDSVLGGGFVSDAIPATVFVGYRTGEFTINNIADILTFDASTTQNFAANAYLRIEERTSADVVVHTQNLTQNAVSAAAGVNWALQGTAKSSADGRIHWATFRGTPAGASWHVDLTVVASSVIGVLEDAAANAVVGPRSIEVIIQIQNYPYATNTNRLVIVHASCTGTSSTTASSVVSGTGLSRAYVFASSQARINGNNEGITIGAWTAVSVSDFDRIIGNARLKQLLNAKFSNNYQCYTSTAAFPPGASSITWDPTVGVGATVAEQRNSASAFVPSIAFIVLSVLALLWL